MKKFIFYSENIDDSDRNETTVKDKDTSMTVVNTTAVSTEAATVRELNNLTKELSTMNNSGFASNEAMNSSMHVNETPVTETAMAAANVS